MTKFRFLVLMVLTSLSFSIQAENINKSILVATPTVLKPYCTYQSTGEYVGYIPELLDTLSQRVGFEYEFIGRKNNKFKRMNDVFPISALLKQYDLYAFAFPMLETDTSIYCSVPYEQIEFLVVCRKGKTYENPKDLLVARNVVIEHSSTYLKLTNLGAYLKHPLHTTASVENALNLVVEGEIDYFIISDYLYSNVKDLIRERDLRIADAHVLPLDVSFASNNKALIAEIDKVILELSEAGMLEQLSEKWIDDDLFVDYTKPLIYGVCSLLFIVFVLVFRISIRRRSERSALEKVKMTMDVNRELLLGNSDLQQNLDNVLMQAKVTTLVYDCEKQVISFVHGKSFLIDDDSSQEEHLKYIHPADRAIFFSELKKVQAKEIEKMDFNYRIVFPGQPIKWYRAVGMPVFDNEGKMLQISGTRQDITEYVLLQEQLENSYKTTLEILDKLPIPIYIFDPHTMEFEYRNSETKHFFNMKNQNSMSEILDKQYFESTIAQNIEMMKTGKDFEANEVLMFADGEKRNTLVKKGLFEYKNKQCIIVARIDLTAKNEFDKMKELLDFALPAVNAFSWTVNVSTGVINYGETLGRLSEFNTIEKFSKTIDKESLLQVKNKFSSYDQFISTEDSVLIKANFGETGEYEWWEARWVPKTIVVDGEVQNIIVGFTINVEERKKLETQLDIQHEDLRQLSFQNELILQNSATGLVYLDEDYTVLWTNLQNVKDLDCAPFTFNVGDKCYLNTEIEHVCTAPSEEECTCRNEAVYQLLNPEEGKYYDSWITPTHADGKKRFILRIENVTNREILQQGLKEAKLKAEESERLKMAFLANMSHEIRTPLNAIVGFSDLLSESTDEEEKTEFSHIIKTNSDMLIRLINDILDLSKLEANMIDVKPELLNLKQVFTDLYAVWILRDNPNNLTLDIDVPEYEYETMLDKKILLQVMTNYLSNAYKYTASGSVKFGYNLHDDGIRVFVQDTGIGIPADKQLRTFGRFEKLDEFAQGTGLGLSICKALAELLGGEVGFTSYEGVGSIFWAYIPCDVLNKSDEKAEKPANSENKKSENLGEPELSQKRILIAEDTDSNFRLIYSIIKDKYQFSRAFNGKEAVEFATEEHFDIILMDMNMPIMNGIQATKAIRKFNPTIPIIAITANAFESDVEAAFDAGCTDFLPKPFEPKDLLKLLK